MLCLLGWLPINSQEINRINAFFRKARRFGLCSFSCVCDVSEYLRMVDNSLFNCIQSPSHCLSHLLPPQKHHPGLRPRGHSYSLPICPLNLCKRFFLISRCLFCFIGFTVLPIAVSVIVLTVLTFAFVFVVPIKRYHITLLYHHMWRVLKCHMKDQKASNCSTIAILFQRIRNASVKSEAFPFRCVSN